MKAVEWGTKSANCPYRADASIVEVYYNTAHSNRNKMSEFEIVELSKCNDDDSIWNDFLYEVQFP